MKLLSYSLLGFLFSVIVITGCSKSNSSTSNSSDISNQLTASGWGIHYYYGNGTDNTKLFSSYSFTFKKDSTLLLSNTTESYNGGWFTQKKSDGTVQLTINIASLTQVQLLNNNWKVVSNDGTLITLKDYSASDDRELHLIRQ